MWVEQVRKAVREVKQSILDKAGEVGALGVRLGSGSATIKVHARQLVNVIY